MKTLKLAYLLILDWLDERNFIYEQNYWKYCFEKDRFELMIFSNFLKKK